MIIIKKPYIKKNKDRSRLCFDLTIDEEDKKVWFEVDKEYEKYLCDDRVDPIVVGLLHYAMRNNHNIKSDSYITEELLYKINTYLIPTLSKYDNRMHNIKIDIKTKETCSNAGGVGTGCSCGVDSMHSYISNSKQKSKQFKLTHLCINSVGSFNESYADYGVEKIKEARYKKSLEFAKKVKLPLVITNSNFFEEINQVHYYTHTYSSTFAILCLQKLWRTYYYGSSGCDYSTFSVFENAEHDCANYELLSLDCFSTNNLKIYSDGATKNRVEKTEYICNNKLTKKYLHVCLKKDYNCGVCQKCMRTLLTLYALDVNMNEYKQIFDIEHFMDNKKDYFKWIYEEYIWGDKTMNTPIYELLLKKKEFIDFIQDYEKNNTIEKPIDYEIEYKKVINSKTFKLGDLILKIPRKIKNIIKK